MAPNFSGEYVLDRAACALSPHASGIATAVLRFEHEEPRLRCSASFASAADTIEFTFERFTDGRGVAGSAHETSRCYWEDDALVSEDRMGAPEAVVVMTWRYELADGGRRMRATERIRGGGRDQDNVWEFTRR
jgi:hypothetical protein